MFQSGKLLPRPPETVGAGPTLEGMGPGCAYVPMTRLGMCRLCRCPSSGGSLAWLLTQPEGWGAGVSFLQPSNHWA